MNARIVNIVLAVLSLVFLMSALNGMSESRSAAAQTSYSQFLAEVKRGEVSEVYIDGPKIRGRRQNGEPFVTYSPPEDPGLVGDLVEGGVEIRAIPPKQPSFLGQLLASLLPMALLIGVWIYFMRRMQGGAGGSGVFSFGKSRAKKFGEDEVKVTLADVAGVDEAREC